MAELEFKYLNEIDISDSLTDSAHVIVEDGGNIRRAPMNQLVTSGGVSSWNDLEDKPFYDEDITIDITHDWSSVMNGNVNDDYIVVPNGHMIHVSDYVLTNELAGLTIGYTVIEDGVVTEDTLNIDPGYIISYGDNLTMVGEMNLFIAHCDNVELDDIIFPKAGIYFVHTDWSSDTKEEHLYTTSLHGDTVIVHKLDDKYLNTPLLIDIVDMNDVQVKYEDIADAYNNGRPVLVKIFGSTHPAHIAPLQISGPLTIMYGVIFEESEYSNVSENIVNAEIFKMVIAVQHPLMGGASKIFMAPSLPSASAEPSFLISEEYRFHTVPLDEILASSLPDVGSNGQILGVIDGAWAPMDAPSGLPEITTENNGNVLTVVDGAWVAGEIEIPEVDYPVTSVNGQTGDVTIDIPAVPTSLPNPNAVTFTGAVEAIYDGSSAVSVAIPVVEKELPEATVDNNGAFLRIVDGVPTWVMLEIAEEGAY